jgi:hypothetical protein
MKMKLALLLACSGLAACETFQLDEPRTIGEVNTGNNYIPVDPLQVDVLLGSRLGSAATAFDMRDARYIRCVARGARPGDPDNRSADLMDALPDHTIRMAVRKVSGSARAGFAPVEISSSGSTYQVIVDSIFADTTNVRFGIRVRDGSGGAVDVMSLAPDLPDGADIEVVRLNDIPQREHAPPEFQEITIPLYVGVGLRLTANVFALRGGINLSNLPALAASVEAERAEASLTMQTLGIYNQQVASTFPIPSELNTSTIQTALISLGSVKAILYDRDTGTRPRVTGIYNPMPSSDPQLINRIYTALAARPIPWAPCGSS